MEPKFKPGDRVAYLWGPMVTKTGVVKNYHGHEIYTVEDSEPVAGHIATRFLYESELVLDADAK